MSVISLNRRAKALVVHPFPMVADALAAILDAAGYAVTRGDAAAALPGDSDLAIVGALAGLDAVRAVRAAARRTILLCHDLEPAPLLAAVELGVDGVLLATAPVATVTLCVDAVAGGEQWLDPAAMKLVIDRVARPPLPALTRRERDVANLVTAGHRNRAIADALGISEGTVKMHLHNVYAKLGLESRTQLAMELRARAA